MFLDNVYRDSFDIWKDCEDIRNNDLYLNNSNLRKSSLPKVKNIKIKYFLC